MSQENIAEAKELIAALRQRLGDQDKEMIVEKLMREVRRIDGGKGSDKDYEATARRLLKITGR